MPESDVWRKVPESDARSMRTYRLTNEATPTASHSRGKVNSGCCRCTTGLDGYACSGVAGGGVGAGTGGGGRLAAIICPSVPPLSDHP